MGIAEQDGAVRMRPLAPGAAVAVIGTGIMGGHMARRLAQAGFAVTAWNRSPAKADGLAAHGVRRAATPAAALAGADAAVVMLSTGAVADEILFAGTTPAIAALAPGATLVVMSSIPVETCRAQAAACAARSLAYVDAPVSGGEVGARAGTLAIMAGGAPEIVAGLAPLFTPLGRATRIGPVGTGQLAKLANQIIVGAAMVGIAEAFTFAAKGGADLAGLRTALMGGFGESKVLDIHGARMAAGDFVPGSPAQYQLKDLRTAQALAAEFGLSLTLLDAMTGIFTDMIAHGGTDRDVSAVFEEVGRRAGGRNGH
ncbi:NAD(P)-dependent oxidoreductase [Aquabacter spiritensis]|uniref:2-hydroxy-3-oxopropionate reductase n=1 Tax=Aquabacter spiritensis TaxID=933073 RepID=A0A4R3LYF0_9HYPH|nr:NAD(P)-dependent oxidoreductase [Aquabacter spiritensis]TCT05710.1 2-hydroxy-3-oxopropionate reductase [Aquabacter spiritensis]